MDLKFRSILYYPHAGQTFRHYIQVLGHLPLHVWVSFQHLWEGVRLMASHQFVHFDVKFDNVVYNERGRRAGFIDFGLSFQRFPPPESFEFSPIFPNWPPEWFLFRHFGTHTGHVERAVQDDLAAQPLVPPRLAALTLRFFREHAFGMPTAAAWDELDHRLSAQASAGARVSLGGLGVGDSLRGLRAVRAVVQRLRARQADVYVWSRVDSVRDAYRAYLTREYFGKAGESGFAHAAALFKGEEDEGKGSAAPRVEQCVGDLAQLLLPHPEAPGHAMLSTANLTAKFDTHQLGNTMRYCLRYLPEPARSRWAPPMRTFLKHTMHYSWRARATPEEALREFAGMAEALRCVE